MTGPNGMGPLRPADSRSAYDLALLITVGGVIWFEQLIGSTSGSAGDPIGGTITTPGDGYRYHTFLVANGFDNRFYPMDTAGKTVDLFGIGGGGSGGARPSGFPKWSGGGGAGEKLHNSALALNSNGLSVSIGAATASLTIGSTGRNGNSTTITYNGSTTTLLGGSAGGVPSVNSGNGNSAGGSGGGGAAGPGVTGTGGAGSTGGNNGAAAASTTVAGGGGGANAAASGQNGGQGYEWPTGSGTRYGGGGAAGSGGTGGAGGGGNPLTAGTANTGSGGGGYDDGSGGSGAGGAAGRVALRYAYP